MSDGMTWQQWRARSRPIEVHGRQVATYDLGVAARGGDDPTLSFVHGFPSSSLDAAGLVDRLGARWRIVTLDLPGFGASAKPAGPSYSIHHAVDAVEAGWRAAGVSRVLLSAHDYGVSVAQELLARRNEGSLEVEIVGLVWMNGGLWPELHHPTVGQQLLLDPENGPGLAAALDEGLFVEGVRGTWGTRRPPTESALHEMWCSMAEGGGVARMHELMYYVADRRIHRARWEAALESCDLPMAFVWGEVDPVSGVQVADRIAERLPDAPLTRLAGVGHWPPLEAPDEVAAVIDAMWV